MITLRIDVTKLNKNRFERVKNRDGTESVFCDLAVFDASPKKAKDYDYFIRQGVKPEENGRSMPILGVGRNFDYPRYTPAL